jgi:hypothetical protein
VAERDDDHPVDDEPTIRRDSDEPEAAPIDAVLSSLEEDPPTDVDHTPVREADDDPISAIIRAESPPGVERIVRLGAETEETYLPPPAPEAPTESDEFDVVLRRTRSPRAAPSTGTSTAAGGRAARPSELGSETNVVAVADPRAAAWKWTALATLAGLLALVYFKTDVFRPAARRERAEAEERARKAKEEEAEARRKKPGTVAIESTPDGAAVWMLLGRTPVDSFALSVAAVHQVRVDHDGFRSVDIDVASERWSGTGSTQRAVVAVTLEAARPGAPSAPAAPAAPPSATTDRAGAGVLHIESTPPGAEAYLLIGWTPGAEITGLEAGRAYEFKVVKDGHRPAFVVIRESEWVLPSGGMVATVTRSATLTPNP